MILECIRRVFASSPSAHLDGIGEALLKDPPNEPVRPMSDQELARAIREFRALPVSGRTIPKLSRRFVEIPRED
ncbi:hypothetical protein [Bradyrhizobium sp. 21]|uniref:hypothetical protein n=1 Tax=Bradyrhizobium sp. 21 TaxID=2782666 RepID=UPI001FF914E1|nr:hypothetical protein [Bradyrhizobium sp. 21]